MASINQLTKTPVKEALYESDSTSVQLPNMKRQFEKKARPETRVKPKNEKDFTGTYLNIT